MKKLWRDVKPGSKVLHEVVATIWQGLGGKMIGVNLEGLGTIDITNPDEEVEVLEEAPNDEK